MKNKLWREQRAKRWSYMMDANGCRAWNCHAEPKHRKSTPWGENKLKIIGKVESRRLTFSFQYLGLPQLLANEPSRRLVTSASEGPLSTTSSYHLPPSPHHSNPTQRASVQCSRVRQCFEFLRLLPTNWSVASARHITSTSLMMVFSRVIWLYGLPVPVLLPVIITSVCKMSFGFDVFGTRSAQEVSILETEEWEWKMGKTLIVTSR